MSSRERRRAARVAVVALTVSLAGAGTFAVAFWQDAPIQLMGAGLAAAFGGLSLALGVMANGLLPKEPCESPWPAVVPEAEERRALAEDLRHRGMPLRRRSLLLAFLAGTVAAVGAVVLFPVRSLGPRPARALFQTAWSAGARLVRGDGTPVTVGDVAVGGFLTVWPEGHTDAGDSHVVLIRTEPGDIRPREGREDWSPGGYVAYSKICTHAGCPVALYDQVTQQLFCPCEQAVFDVTDGARPVAGPAPRSLPQLALSVDGDGFLRARGDFDEPVGPGFWERGA